MARPSQTSVFLNFGPDFGGDWTRAIVSRADAIDPRRTLPDVAKIGEVFACSGDSRGRRLGATCAGAPRRLVMIPCHDWFLRIVRVGRSARQSRFAERKAMINREHDLPSAPR